MNAFGDNFGDVDPAAEFLAREQNELAGLEDDLNPVTSGMAVVDGFKSDGIDSSSNDIFDTQPANEPTFQDDMGFGESNGDTFSSGNNENYNIEQAAMRSMSPEEGSPNKLPPAPVKMPREEPEKIRIWREEQKKRLEEKDENEEKKKQEWREAAKRELDDWYKHHEELVAKTKAANRNAEKELVAESEEIEPGTEWERIAKLCDFNPKASKASRDVSRMRSIILQLKQNPLPQRS